MKNYVYSSKFYTLLVFSLFTFSSLRAQNLHIFASPNGSSTGDGSSASAPVNLEQAKAVARAHPQQACIIYLANGTYSSFSLDSSDSRSAGAPAVYVSNHPRAPLFPPQYTFNRATFQPLPAATHPRILHP